MCPSPPCAPRPQTQTLMERRRAAARLRSSLRVRELRAPCSAPSLDLRAQAYAPSPSRAPGEEGRPKRPPHAARERESGDTRSLSFFNLAPAALSPRRARESAPGLDPAQRQGPRVVAAVSSDAQDASPVATEPVRGLYRAWQTLFLNLILPLHSRPAPSASRASRTPTARASTLTCGPVSTSASRPSCSRCSSKRGRREGKGDSF